MRQQVCALITNIQNYSIHDGPGIRTVVFFKGCSLRCLWCSNPECISSRPEVGLFVNLCTGCGTCVEVCPTGATTLAADGHVAIDRNRCTACGACVTGCRAEARVLWGKEADLEEVVARVARDKMFYDSSGGGVTVSGGEPLLESEFVSRLLERCHDLDIHTCVETSGHVSWNAVMQVLPQTDLFLYDLKMMDAKRHLELTGSTNKQILENARRLVREGASVFFRMPLVPGINDDEENIGRTAAFLHEVGVLELELMPYHKFGLGKYLALGRDYALGNIKRPTSEEVGRVQETFKILGVECKASL
ncbi:MAG: glycyl-radical enzyme activating protein [Thermoleophilia bacterium]|nr:glycyl-radical enzyme activating protein [Thermoleophilia bacterium]